MDDLALQIGRIVLAGAFLFGWFAAGVKAADNGHEALAWVIGLTPPAIFILALFGVFS
ncbi:hypothetical protein [Lentibacter sp. XHP0401]|uniref:hypothetical protein n=1 Tax=Lentibacter sp. XHP0401 TaxID=2984334 RepID=UPI0021E8AF55|nr:hypothetical protein [Lentibacter sp. XHP0401]MCV2892454.1 hypothetical protein [Lentibacter sp. XHP0401]